MADVVSALGLLVGAVAVGAPGSRWTLAGAFILTAAAIAAVAVR